MGFSYGLLFRSVRSSDLLPLLSALCFLLQLVCAPAPSLSLLWLQILGAAGTLFPTYYIPSIIPEVFLGKIKNKLKETCREGDKIPLLFRIPFSPPQDSVLISLWEAPMLHGPQTPNRCADPMMMMSSGSARGAGLCWRALGLFYVVSQPGQTNPAERSYKSEIVNFSC